MRKNNEHENSNKSEKNGVKNCQKILIYQLKKLINQLINTYFQEQKH